jgi:hypothetical protein
MKGDSIMNDLARDTLQDIVRSHGLDIIKYPDRCEGLLRDHCADCRLEISVLVGALKERVPAELLKPISGVPRDAQLGLLARRLEENLGLTESVAAWAVDTWAIALDQPPSSRKREPSSRPGGGVGSDPGSSSPTGRSPVLSGRWVGPAVATVLVATLAFAGTRIWTRFQSGTHDQSQGQDSTTGQQGQAQNDGQEGRKGQDGKGRQDGQAARGGQAGQDRQDRRDGSAGQAGSGKAGDPAGSERRPEGEGARNDRRPGDEDRRQPRIDRRERDQSPPVTLRTGTRIDLRIEDTISSESANVGDTYRAVVDRAVMVKGDPEAVIPRGSDAVVRVTSVERAGRVKGAAQLTLQLVQVSIANHSYDVRSSTWTRQARPRGATTAKRAGVVGAIAAGIGAVIHGKKGAVTGGAVGATGAIVYDELNPGEPIRISPEAAITVTLRQPLSIGG